MNGLESMRQAMVYIENNLRGEIDYHTVAQVALCSPYHFQRMFSFFMGVPLSEYIRRRRLTLAGFDLQTSKDKVIDIAERYGYTSPDAFSRAFQTVHKVTPSKARQEGVSLKVFPRITFNFSISGGQELTYRITEKPAFSIIGIKERFSYLEDLGGRVGEMWQGLDNDLVSKMLVVNSQEPFGLVGAYCEIYEENATDYYIGVFSKGSVSESFSQLEIPSQMWAIFEIVGPIPTAMRKVWGQIFSEWFPTTGYQHTFGPEIEWYSKGDMSQPDYQSEIWIPVIKK